MNIILSNLGFVCALGTSHADIVAHAKNGDTTGMFGHDVRIGDKTVPFGSVHIETKHSMRFHDLTLAAVAQIIPAIEQIKSEFSPARLGIVIGASNTAVHEAQKHISHNAT